MSLSQRKLELEKIATDSAKQLLSNTLNGSSMWTYRGTSKHGVRIFKGERQDRVSSFRGEARIEGTLDEIIHYHSDDSTEAYRKRSKHASVDISDAAVIATIKAPRNKKDAYIGVKWVAIRSSSR